MNIQIIEVKHSCPTCKQPVVNAKVAEGIRINEIASLGSRLFDLKARKKSELRDLRIAELECHIKDLGGSFDADGFIHS